MFYPFWQDADPNPSWRPALDHYAEEHYAAYRGQPLEPMELMDTQPMPVVSDAEAIADLESRGVPSLYDVVFEAIRNKEGK